MYFVAKEKWKWKMHRLDCLVYQRALAPSTEGAETLHFFFFLKKHFLWSSWLKWIWLHVFLVSYKLGFEHFSFEIFLGKFRVRLNLSLLCVDPNDEIKKLKFIMVSFIVTPFTSYILQIIKIMHFKFRGLMNSVIICF